MNTPHWHYFVALCQDFEKTTRFVELSPDNFSTYSIQFARIYLAIGSEIDVVAKLVCQQIDPSKSAKNIDQYRRTIVGKYPQFPTVEVRAEMAGIQFTPWADWGSQKQPSWWTCYNDVKHERNRFFKSANLENTLNALGGLLVLTGYLYSMELSNCSLGPSGNVITFANKYYSGVAMRDHGNVAGYRMPGAPQREPPLPR